VNDGSGARWRFRGGIPREETFERLLWEGVQSQYIVEDRRSLEPVGLVTSYGSNFATGTTKLAAVIQESIAGRGLGIEATLLLARLVFETWPMRKAYLEIPAYNVVQLHSAIGRYIHQEGQLLEDEWFHGRYWDSFIFAMYRPDVERFFGRFPRPEHETQVGTYSELANYNA
jgi:RimJ/RimL family protein N-acetyltransferase